MALRSDKVSTAWGTAAAVGMVRRQARTRKQSADDERVTGLPERCIPGNGRPEHGAGDHRTGCASSLPVCTGCPHPGADPRLLLLDTVAGIEYTVLVL